MTLRQLLKLATTGTGDDGAAHRRDAPTGARNDVESNRDAPRRMDGVSFRRR